MLVFPEKHRPFLGLADAELRSKLAELSADELTELRSEMRDYAKQVGELAEVDASTLNDIKGARVLFDYAKDVAAERSAADEAAGEDLDSTLAAFEDEDAENDDDESTEELAAKTTSKAGEDAETAQEKLDEVAQAADDTKAKAVDTKKQVAKVAKNEAASYTPTARRRVRASELAEQPAEQVATPERIPTQFVATSGVDGKIAGEPFKDNLDLSAALLKRFDDIAGGGTEKIVVAKALANFDSDHILDGANVSENLAKLGGADLRQQGNGSPNSLVAAICAPAEPYYGLVAMSSTARPVRGSLGQYAAPRGAVTVYPSPHLADVVSGRGVWTRANDAAGNTTKLCAVIPCSSPTQYDIYGVWRCLTVTNMMAMTYPELVDAFQNRLQALQASLAESTLLNAMVGSVNTRNLTADLSLWGYSANQSLLDTFVETLSAYKEAERYDDGQRFDAWAPRWVKAALVIDIINRKNLTGTNANVAAATSDVEAAIAGVGLDINWTLDYASDWTQAPVLPADAGAIPALPHTANLILSPKGNFRVLDRGELTIGVTNNNIYRDNASNAKNQFTMFFENFEGLIDFGATSVELTISNFKATGSQVADTTVTSR